MADFDTALALNPEMSDVWWNRGLTNIQLERYGEAEKDFARCLSLNPPNKAELETLLKELRQQGQKKPLQRIKMVVLVK